MRRARRRRRSRAFESTTRFSRRLLLLHVSLFQSRAVLAPDRLQLDRLHRPVPNGPLRLFTMLQAVRQRALTGGGQRRALDLRRAVERGYRAVKLLVSLRE